MFDKRLTLSLLIVTLLQCSLGTSFSEPNLNQKQMGERATEPGYRLPTDFKPEHYSIQLSDIDFEAQTFAGSTVITFWCLSSTSTLILHSKDLVIMQIAVTIVNLNDTSEIFTQTITPNDQYETLSIEANPWFVAGNLYQITFAGYTGVMSHSMAGFYTSKYTLYGQTQWLGTTQMQQTHARKVFPCFDEPSFKATFSLAIHRPDNYEISISNMKIDKDASSANNWDRFLETPVMSTYLLAFIVSKFHVLNQVEESNGSLFRVVGRPGAEGQGAYAFEEGLKLLAALNDYMNLDYFSLGNNKMDQAAIPDFAAGAMENWGLLTYREAYLLADENTSVRYSQQISGVLAHEMAHMWFGDYVTCHWWSDTWLNEGFARLFQSKIPDMVTTTMFNTMIQFPVMQVQVALLADTTVRSVPLTNVNVNTLGEVDGQFGTISYSKGASVIRMVENWLGEENFRESLNSYMIANAYGVVTPQNLYDALQENVPEVFNVTAMMSTWVEVSGYPVINVEVDYNGSIMKVSQKRFKKPWEANVNHLFQVPITYATRTTANFDDTTADYLLTEESAILPISITAEDWIVLNKKQTGYYRVNYDENSWYNLRSALMGSERTAIHQNNKGQIVDDLFNLAREDVLSYKTTFDVLEFLQYEDQYAPWQAALPGFSFIRQQLNMNRNLLAKLDYHIVELLDHAVKTLGFEDEGENLTKLFRINLMNFACSLGQDDCVNFAKGTYTSYVASGAAIPANLREFVYCSGLREGDEDAFDALWEKFKSENLANEVVVLLGALGCTKSEAKINQLLDEIVKPNSLVRDHDMMTPVNAILNSNLDNTEILLKYIEDRENFVALRNRLGTMSTLFTNLATRLTNYQINRFHQLIIDNTDILSMGEITSGMIAYSNLALQASYMIEAGNEIESWLDAKQSARVVAVRK